MKKQVINKIVSLFAVLLLAAGVSCLALAGTYYAKGYFLSQKDQSRAEAFHNALSLESDRGEEQQENQVENVQLAKIREQLGNLQEKNPEVIGWLFVEGTTIDYPVVQAEDNEYYLTHNLEGEEDSHGAIFLDCRNDLTVHDQKWIIYGHNMKDLTMFGSLRKYKDNEYLQEHKEIIFYDEQGEHIFTVKYAKIWNGEEGTYELPTEDGQTKLLLSTCDKGNSRLIIYAE